MSDPNAMTPPINPICDWLRSQQPATLSRSSNSIPAKAEIAATLQSWPNATIRVAVARSGNEI